MGRAGRRARLAGLEAQAPASRHCGGCGSGRGGDGGRRGVGAAVRAGPRRHRRTGCSTGTAVAVEPSHRDEPVRFADGSTAVPFGGIRGIAHRHRGHPAADCGGPGQRRRPVRRCPATGAGVRGAGGRGHGHRAGHGLLRRACRGSGWRHRHAGGGAGRLGRRPAATCRRGRWLVSPLVVSPAAAEEPAEVPAKEERPVRHKRKRVDDGAATPAPTPPAPPAVEPSEPAAPLHRRGELLADADRARLAGRFEDGASLLQRLIREHPGDQRAPLAAFSLGRILLGELRRPAEAAQAFARVRTLAPDGPLAEDALAREVEAWARAGISSGPGGVQLKIRACTRTEPGRRT